MPTYKTERTSFTYAVLHNASWSCLKQAQDSKEGQFYNCIAAMVFCAFVMEAYLNHLAPHYIPEWWKREKRWGREGRLSRVCKVIHFEPDRSSRPFKT